MVHYDYAIQSEELSDEQNEEHDVVPLDEGGIENVGEQYGVAVADH